MPRQARLDAPGILHHVMVRGLERRAIFRDDADRRDFWARVGALVEATGLTVYAWALLPNHAHLLLRTGQQTLARCMRSLLTGYAGAFNRRHKRVGHLFHRNGGHCFRRILVLRSGQHTPEARLDASRRIIVGHAGSAAT